MENKIKLYDKNDIINKILAALQEMEELGLNEWDSDDLAYTGLAIEILPSNRLLTACDYVLHIFLYVNEDDVAGVHIFDVSTSTKYSYEYWRDDIDVAFENYLRIVYKGGYND